jgi:hypothetical protein
MTFRKQRRYPPYDIVTELTQVEMAIQWRLDQIRMFYKAIDALRDHKERLVGKQDQYDKYQRPYQH